MEGGPLVAAEEGEEEPWGRVVGVLVVGILCSLILSHTNTNPHPSGPPFDACRVSRVARQGCRGQGCRGIEGIIVARKEE